MVCELKKREKQYPQVPQGGNMKTLITGENPRRKEIFSDHTGAENKPRDRKRAWAARGYRSQENAETERSGREYEATCSPVVSAAWSQTCCAV